MCWHNKSSIHQTHITAWTHLRQINRPYSKGPDTRSARGYKHCCRWLCNTAKPGGFKLNALLTPMACSHMVSTSILCDPITSWQLRVSAHIKVHHRLCVRRDSFIHCTGTKILSLQNPITNPTTLWENHYLCSSHSCLCACVCVFTPQTIWSLS